MAHHDIWTVSALNRAVRDLLEQHLGTVWIEAEVSNLARPASGHLYFSLKDANGQLRAAFFRQRQRGSVRDLADGDQVLVRGKLSLYEARGDYQLIVEHMEPAGEGALRRAYEILRLKLTAEGLFEEARKQPLPALPRAIGVVTSPSTAALQDVLNVLARRFPGIPVIVYAATVQGDSAARTLRAALAKAVHRNECDVLLIVRGGGSLEDLQAFNDEQLARDVAACPLPIISGVGHETDVTIVDFVADQRAPTPSAAAEMAVPERRVLLAQIASAAQRIRTATERAQLALAQRIDFLSRRLSVQNPVAQLKRRADALTGARRRLAQALSLTLHKERVRLDNTAGALHRQSPHHIIGRYRQDLVRLHTQLRHAQHRMLEQRQQELAAAGRHLHAVSPLAVLGRGFAIVTDANEHAARASITQIAVDDHVTVRLVDGQFAAHVRSIKKQPSG
ncbi:MAG: exodeoxyribonuclease VII large subunit [Pseudomonadota bacterium]